MKTPAANDNPPTEPAAPARSASLLERVLSVGGIGVIGAGVLAVRAFDPTTTPIFPACPLLKLTGLACPGCGLTRGFHALFHGDLLTALDFNLLLPFFAFFFGYFALSLTLVATRGRGLDFRLFSPKILWSFFAFAMVFAVLRNLPVYPLSVLYP